MMRIGFFGDIHGRVQDFHRILHKIVEEYQITVAIQTGDFGLSKKVIGSLDALGKFPVPVFFVDGNHEDFRFLWKAMKNGMIKSWEKHNLYYQPRGSTILIQGVKVGFMGGALHVGRPQKVIKGNVITHLEVSRAISEFSAYLPDIVVTHSCPAGIGIGMQGREWHSWGIMNHIHMAGFNPGPIYDCGDTQHTHLWDQLKKKPKLWVYGHFHEYKLTEVEHTTFVSLPFFDYDKEYVIWDTQKGGLLTGRANTSENIPTRINR